MVRKYAVTGDDSHGWFRVGDVHFCPSLDEAVRDAINGDCTDADQVEIVEAERCEYYTPSVSELIGGTLEEVDWDYRDSLLMEFGDAIERAQNEVDAVISAINKRGTWSATGPAISKERVALALHNAQFGTDAG